MIFTGANEPTHGALVVPMVTLCQGYGQVLDQGQCYGQDQGQGQGQGQVPPRQGHFDEVRQGQRQDQKTMTRPTRKT